MLFYKKGSSGYRVGCGVLKFQCSGEMRSGMLFAECRAGDGCRAECTVNHFALCTLRFALPRRLRCESRAKSLKRLTSNLYPLTFTLLLLLFGCQEKKPSAHSVPSHTVVDSHGVSVAVPDTVKRVACLDVLCYSIMLTVGEADKVVSSQVNAGLAPWVSRVRPLDGILMLQTTPGVENLLNQHADVVIGGYGGVQETQQYVTAGIVQLHAQPNVSRFQSYRQFVESQKRMVRIYGEILGPKVKARAEDWCQWYEEKIRWVTGRTDTLTHRPKTYFVRGPSPLITHGPGGYVYWYGEMAGADMVVKNDSDIEGKGELSMEELLRWDPEIIFVGRQNHLSVVTQNPSWKNIQAVRTHQILAMPGGVFFWDGGPECGLLLLYLAKHLHPGLFPDLDLRKEVQAYYRRFYACSLSDTEADQLLQGLDSQGHRENSQGI
ncbi:MAG TPA: ABC transporter substrate-binding protein [Fibrobacteraceae bacterium]|nr:ABC transporter substrate-binding protein [Fibrobacteraceae bacterium]